MLLLVSCSQKNIFGTYTIHRPDDGIKIILDSNYRFNYTKKEGLSGWYTSGRWVAYKNAISLTSDKGLTSMNGSVIENITHGLMINKLQFFDFDDSLPLKGTRLTINDKIQKVTDSLGRIEVNTPIETLHIHFDKFDFFYETKNRESNDFKVYLLLGNNSEVYFSNIRYRVKRKSIVDHDGIKYKKE